MRDTGGVWQLMAVDGAAGFGRDVLGCMPLIERDGLRAVLKLVRVVGTALQQLGRMEVSELRV